MDKQWPKPPSQEELKAWLFSVGLVNIHSEGIPSHRLESDDAKEIIANCLEIDLAYGTSRMDESTARDLAQIYVDQIVPEAEFRGPLFTSSLTNATTENGVLTLHPNQTTVFWFMDED